MAKHKHGESSFIFEPFRVGDGLVRIIDESYDQLDIPFADLRAFVLGRLAAEPSGLPVDEMTEQARKTIVMAEAIGSKSNAWMLARYVLALAEEVARLRAELAEDEALFESLVPLLMPGSADLERIRGRVSSLAKGGE